MMQGDSAGIVSPCGISLPSDIQLTERKVTNIRVEDPNKSVTQ